MKSAIRFKQTNIPRQKGEQARLKVIQGPDYGSVFVLVTAHATIGRGEENDIILSDLKASRVHAEIAATSTGWIVKDKGSANGILYNGTATREAKLKLNDTITLGETTLEFATAEASTMMLVAPPRSLDEVQESQKQLEQQKKKLRSMGLNTLFSSGGPSSQSGGPGASPSSSKGKPILWIVGGIAVLILSMADPPTGEKAAKKKKNSSDTQDLASYLPNVEINKTADSIFKEGFREYLAGNLNRARTQFETVLQISPGHPLATLYVENCNKSIEVEIKVNKEYGKKSFKAGKLKDARIHFRRILRLLNRDRSNPDYIEAKDQCEQVEKQMEAKVSSCEGDRN
jgi:pSer/pThr/pTyr-binding forkhead associated (FHA) protein